MTATYDPALSTDKDKVRRLLSDRDMNRAKFSDEEITAVLTEHSSVEYAAASLAETLAFEYAQQPDISVDGASWTYGEMADRYTKLAETLRASASKKAGGVAGPVVTGVSIAAMQAQDLDTDRPADKFGAGRFDSQIDSNSPLSSTQ